MEEAYPVLRRDYPTEREEPGLVGLGPGLPLYRGPALRLVPGLPGGRPLPPLGAPELPAERVRLRGERPGGGRGGLAHPVRGHRSLVRPRGALRRDRRLPGGPSPASRRAVPAPHAAELRRGERGGAAEGAFRGRRRIIPWADGEPDPAPSGAKGLHVPERVLAGVPLRGLLQHPVLHPSGSGGHGAPHPSPLRHRHRDPLRPGPGEGHRGAGHGRGDRRDHGVQGTHRLPLRLHPELHLAPHAVRHRRLARGAGEQLRGTGSQPHGSPLPGGGQRPGRGVPGPGRLRPAPHRVLHSPISEPLRGPAGLPSGLRLPGRRGPAGVVPGGGGARGRGGSSRTRRLSPGTGPSGPPPSGRCSRTTRTG
jgi:hypothetical protein